MFQISSDSGDSGPHHEVQLRLQGLTYYPTHSNHCTHDPFGFCLWRAGQTHVLHSQKTIWVESWETLALDVEEHDTTSQNDSTTISLSSREWYIDTDETYSLRVGAEYDSEKQRSVCYSGDIGASYKGIEGSVGIEDCSHWVDKADNYIFHLKISNP